MHTYKEIAEFCASIYQGRNLLIVPYNFQISFLNVAPGSLQELPLSITANADFVLTEIQCNAAPQADQSLSVQGAVVPAATIQFIDSGTNEQFFDTPSAINNCASVGPNFRSLDYPRFIQGRTTLRTVLQSFYTGATTFPRIDISLNGVLVRAYSGA